MPLLPSFHDDYLIGYDVDCDTRSVTLRIRRYSAPAGAPPVMVVFSEVLWYRFENDAFGNILYAISAIAPARFVENCHEVIVNAIRFGGLPKWMEEPTEATKRLTEKGIQCFDLDSSLGLSGWILARGAAVLGEDAGHKSLTST